MYTLSTNYNPNKSTTCFVCNKEVSEFDGYMVCDTYSHICHKKCLKNKYKHDYDEKLDAGYVYSSGTNQYKKHKCSCESKMKVHNTFMYKVKKGGKYILAPIVIAIILL